MQARLKTLDDIFIIYLNGKLDLDSVEEFQRVCKSEFKTKKLILGLETLSFVGSTGISILLETLRELQRASTFSLKIFGASSEYKKIFFANLEENYEFFETEQQAIISFKRFNPQNAQEFQAHIREKVVRTGPLPESTNPTHFPISDSQPQTADSTRTYVDSASNERESGIEARPTEPDPNIGS